MPDMKARPKNLILPNLILIGAQKSGSTAVYDWLSQHPDIYGNPAMKDFPFFSKPEYFDKGLEWFAGHFKGHRGEPIILHGYVHYLFLDGEIAARLKAFNPDLKLLALLRNPVDRAFSGYLQARKTGNESIATFEEAIQADQTGSLHTLRERVDRSYLSHGLYARQLEAYFEHFPSEQIHAELYDNVRNNPLECCARLFNFAGVDPAFQPRLRRKNDYGKPRFAAIEKAIQRGLPKGLVHKLVPLSIRTRLRQRVRAVNTVPTAKPILNPATRALLADFYSDEITRLESLTGLDLHPWRAGVPAPVDPATP
jgi:hypothetical protein